MGPVLVLGATGFIGPPLVRALRAAGAEVVAASRGGGGEGGVALDRRDPGAVRTVVRARGVGVVVDLLAFTEADTLPLLSVLDGEVGRYVLASSCDVYRNYEGLHRKARPAPILGPLDEDSPLRSLRHPYRATPRRPPGAADAWMDDYDKIPLEAALLARPGLGGVVLRLPMVYGPGDRQRRVAWALRPMLAGGGRLNVDPAWLAWRTTYGFVDDVAHALATAALGRAHGVFNLGEAAPPDHAGWIARFADALAWRGELEARAAPDGSPLAALDLSYPLAVDNSAFRHVFAWREPTALADALARTAADERARW